MSFPNAQRRTNSPFCSQGKNITTFVLLYVLLSFYGAISGKTTAQETGASVAKNAGPQGGGSYNTLTSDQPAVVYDQVVTTPGQTTVHHDVLQAQRTDKEKQSDTGLLVTAKKYASDGPPVERTETSSHMASSSLKAADAARPRAPFQSQNMSSLQSAPAISFQMQAKSVLQSKATSSFQSATTTPFRRPTEPSSQRSVDTLFSSTNTTLFQIPITTSSKYHPKTDITTQGNGISRVTHISDATFATLSSNTLPGHQKEDYTQILAKKDGSFPVNVPQNLKVSTLTQQTAGNEQIPTEFLLAEYCFWQEMYFRAVKGVVHEVRFPVRLNNDGMYCSFTVTSPVGTRLLAYIDRTSSATACGRSQVNVVLTQRKPGVIGHKYNCSVWDFRPSRSLVSFSNQMFFEYRPWNEPTFTFSIKLQALEQAWFEKLPVVRTTDGAGFVTSRAYNGVNGSPLVPKIPDAWAEIDVPAGNDIMVSFPTFKIQDTITDLAFAREQNVRVKDYIPRWECHTFVDLYVVDKTGKNRRAWRKCHDRVIPARVYRASRLRLRMRSIPSPRPATGFKMFYSFHNLSTTPQQLDNGLFNCSVDHYPTFQQHLDCNLEPECHGGQDETQHCPFSSPACKGRVASGNKCFFYARSNYTPPTAPNDLVPIYTRQRVISECLSVDGQLAMIKNKAELRDFTKLFQFGKRGTAQIVIGAAAGLDPHTPLIYKRLFRWTDKTIVYFQKHLPFLDMYLYPVRLAEPYLFTICLVYNVYKRLFMPFECRLSNTELNGVICETQPQPTSKLKLANVAISISQKSGRKITLVPCPQGHMTFSFLVCDRESACGAGRSVSRCRFSNRRHEDDDSGSLSITIQTLSIPMFLCDDDFTSIPYSLVCDFKHDCADKSDESFCRYPPCAEFQCSNGQCVHWNITCDGFPDCLDWTDEWNPCFHRKYFVPDVEGPVSPPNPPVPAIIDFDIFGRLVTKKMNPNDSCPATHYRCPGEEGYCLPVYTRCNGFYDCPGREDEANCGNVTCPGFYRCRASSICVHPDHICDGWPQCPQYDDELYCGTVGCPDGCLCQGFALLCYKRFPPELWLPIDRYRYLDASGSGMTLSDLVGCVRLIALILVRCSIDFVSENALPNLQSLDLSDNDLVSLNFSVFLGYPNLRILRLSRNPLSFTSYTESNKKVDTLESLDLSQTELVLFDSGDLRPFPRMRHLNLSFTSARSIGERGFGSIPQLTELDLRGIPLEYFPADVFQGLTQLRVIFASNYRLCCASVLPLQLQNPDCITQQSQLSSCEMLLPWTSYRFYFFLASATALSCNVICILLNSREKLTKGGVGIITHNLNTAYAMMSIFLGIVATADAVFKGKYLQNEQAWKSSVACKVAAFFFVLSTETSLLTIVLLTLDRFLVLHVRSTRFSFGTNSAVAVCLMTWFVGSALAVVPLLPATSHWEVYGQTGICIPVTATKPGFAGQTYWLGLQAYLNLSFCLLALIGQSFIYRVVNKDSRKVSLEKTSEHIVLAKRLTITAFAHILPVAVIGISSLVGFFSSDSEQTNIPLTVFVLPLKSALSPVLYIITVVAEHQRDKREARLLYILKSRVSQQKVASA